jgi:hypothetical protein
MSDYELIDPVTITTRCIECENIFTIVVSREDIDSYSKGDNKTYHLFKNLTPSEVDFHFIHNICQDCFDEYYQDEE